MVHGTVYVTGLMHRPLASDCNRDHWPKFSWPFNLNLSLQAVRKKQLEREGKLGKFGKIIDATPASVREEFGDLATKTKDSAESAATADAATKQEPGVETLSAVSTATPTAVALSAKRKVWHPWFETTVKPLNSRTCWGVPQGDCLLSRGCRYISIASKCMFFQGKVQSGNIMRFPALVVQQELVSPSKNVVCWLVKIDWLAVMQNMKIWSWAG